MPDARAAEIVLTDEERAELEEWARRRTSAAGLAMRSRIVLAVADGQSNSEMARRLGVSRSMVKRWRNRFAQARCGGLLDEPRPGRPRLVDDAQIEALITCPKDPCQQRLTRMKTPQLSLGAASCSSHRRTDGGVAAAHLPFPGLGHVRRDPDRYTWVPITYAPVEESSTHSRCVDQRCAPSVQASLVAQSCRVRR